MGRVNSLERQVRELQDSVADFRDLRHGFLCTFQRDILQTATDADYWIVATGNRFAHGGHCKRDADPYEPPAPRRDYDVYVTLYGLHPSIVRSFICKFLGDWDKKWQKLIDIAYLPTIEILDKHATILADTNRTFSTEVHNRFARFIQSLEKSNYAKDYLKNPKSRVLMAHWVFVNSLDKEMRWSRSLTYLTVTLHNKWLWNTNHLSVARGLMRSRYHRHSRIPVKLSVVKSLGVSCHGNKNLL